MVSFCCFDFAKEYHLLSNQKVFARVFQVKTFLPKRGVFPPVFTWAGNSDPGSCPEHLPFSAKEYIPGLSAHFRYSVSSMDWARLASTLTPGPIVEVIVICLM
jgi:hypothetical protein